MVQARASEGGAVDAAARQLAKTTAGNAMKIRVNDFVLDGIVISLEPNREFDITREPERRQSGRHGSMCRACPTGGPLGVLDISN